MREHYKPSNASLWTWIECIAIVAAAIGVIAAVITGHTLDFYGR